ncbi:MAG: type IV pilus twitching motility protein PilT [Kiritimatiellia bacterium]
MTDPVLDPLFALMVAADATDLHWFDGGALALRVHGSLRQVAAPPELAAMPFEALTARLVGEAGLETLRRVREYDGADTAPGNRRIRINAYWKLDRLAWAIRLLPNRFFAFEELGLPIPLLEEICALRQGLVLVTGATGSGKTTTLASILHRINQTRSEHLFTIEDPVEYVHESDRCLVSQREVGHDTASFRNALRSVLREDPDVVLLGEMRDRTSMDAALTLAETGHLTFATLHTSGAAESVSRIVSAFDAMEQQQVRERLAANLKVVVTQQLVPWTDRSGRSLCAEIMTSTKAIQSSIRDQKERQLASLIELGGEQGMVTLNGSLMELVRRRRITRAEAMRYSNDPDALARM